MKERPILFSGEMVRAILEGRKTQTRRVVKPQSAILTDSLAEALGVRAVKKDMPVIPCPFGQVGDRLWVRETWVKYPHAGQDGAAAPMFRADGIVTDEMVRLLGQRWRPSIHMPRWASRITLEITDIRVERLMEISEEDALAEGVAIDRGSSYHVAGHEGKWAHATARGCFETLWNSINGPCAFSKNEWVWAITFKRVEGSK